jgi:alkylated DNA repair dioxygenase AlkB
MSLNDLIKVVSERKDSISSESILDGQGLRLFLTGEKSSWVDLFFVKEFVKKGMFPGSIDFEALWNLHPKERGQIKIMNREVEVPRFQQTYGCDYTFSGMKHKSLPVPDEFLPFLDLANELKYTANPLNQLLANWYEDGKHYIGAHSDDERDIIKEPNGDIIVFSYTLQDSIHENNRLFRLKPKVGKHLTDEEKRILSKERIDIELVDGLLLIMGGTTQKTHKHQVPKTTKNVGRRINITCRCFKT